MAAAPEENIRSLKAQIARVFEESLRITLPDEAEVAPIIAPCARKEAGDYQCNNAMSLWSKIKGKEGIPFKGPQPVGKAIMENLRPTDMIESCSVAGPGFINVILSRQWIAQSILRMVTYGKAKWCLEVETIEWEPCGLDFVQFVEPADAEEAKYQMDGQILLGRQMTVVFAEENRKKPSDMRVRERRSGSRFSSDRRRSPPPRYSRSPRYARSPPPRYDRSRSPRRDYSPAPRRRHCSRSVSPVDKRYSRKDHTQAHQ